MGMNPKTKEYVFEFQGKLFIEGERSGELFRKLCNQGCDNEALAALLFAICTMAAKGKPGPLRAASPSANEVKDLVNDLKSLAESVKRLNKSPLNPKHDLLLVPPDVTRDAGRQRIANLYDMLPGIMMVYSFHLERFYKFHRVQLKRLTFNHLATLKLLLYVAERTGSPRYEDLSNLLTAGFLVAGGTEKDIPKIFSADALAKLRQRWTNPRSKR